MVVLSEPAMPTTCWRASREQRKPAQAPKDAGQWRRNGAGAQILADLGLGKLRVLGTPRRQVGLAGYGLEVVEYVAPAPDPTRGVNCTPPFRAATPTR